MLHRSVVMLGSTGLWLCAVPRRWSFAVGEARSLQPSATQRTLHDEGLIRQVPAMVNPRVFPKPIPFGGKGKPVNQNRFSDHFPITMTVTEAD